MPSDEEESSSEEYTDAADSDGEAPRSPDLPRVDARPTRSTRPDLYFSDDSFGYDEYSDDGNCIFVVFFVSRLSQRHANL